MRVPSPSTEIDWPLVLFLLVVFVVVGVPIWSHWFVVICRFWGWMP